MPYLLVKLGNMHLNEKKEKEYLLTETIGYSIQKYYENSSKKYIK